MLAYPVLLTRDDNGTLLVTFPDVPEAATFGKDESQALRRAADALETAFMGRMADRLVVPAPSRPTPGQRTVKLRTLAEAKLLLYAAMRARGVTRSGLARRLGWHMPQVQRLLDLRHASRLDQLEAALEALGKRLEVRALSVRRGASRESHTAPNRLGPGAA
ncbi:MAG: type II toxin-antitoxin system HicB family antitoxin [Alphaproteobacteria bacterium]